MHAVRERIGSIKNLGGLDHQTSRVLLYVYKLMHVWTFFQSNPF